MPRKKAAPKEEKAVTLAPEAEAPETPPVSPDVPQTPEAPPEPSEPPKVPEPPDLMDSSDGESPAGPETPPGPGGLPAIVTASKGLNFRAGPGFSFDVLGVVEFGTLLLVLDLPMGAKVPGWALVWLGETAAWVSDKHLRILVD